VDWSNRWFTDARVGSPNTASRNFSVDVCSYTVVSRWAFLANGEMTHVGTLMPAP
jgi:hypothetical protein